MMKEEFINLAQEIKMQLDTISEEDYEIIENMYVVMNLEKSVFIKIVKAIGIESIILESSRWAYMLRAKEHYQDYLKYIKAKNELEEQQREVERSKAIIANYEKHIRQS